MKCTTQQPDEALLVIILWAVFPVDHVLGDGVADMIAMAEPWPDVLAYFVSVFAAIGAYAGANAVGSWWSGVD